MLERFDLHSNAVAAIRHHRGLANREKTVEQTTDIGQHFWISAPAYLLLVMAAVAALEMLAPRREPQKNTGLRWFNNLALGWLNYWLTNTAAVYALIWVASLAPTLDIGLLLGKNLHPLLGFLILLASTQLLSYWSHWLFHNVPFLWGFHAVHHSDVDFDFSTSYRHHPFEPLISLLLSTPLVLILGLDPLVAFSYQLYASTATVFSHANIKLPTWLEKSIHWFILTPDFHRVHHSSNPEFTNSNYGTLLPWFDYLFGTAKHWDDAQHVSGEIGLEYLREPRDSRLDRIILTPFNIPKSSGNQPEKPKKS